MSASNRHHVPLDLPDCDTDTHPPITVAQQETQKSFMALPFHSLHDNQLPHVGANQMCSRLLILSCPANWSLVHWLTYSISLPPPPTSPPPPPPSGCPLCTPQHPLYSKPLIHAESTGSGGLSCLAFFIYIMTCSPPPLGCICENTHDALLPGVLIAMEPILYFPGRCPLYLINSAVLVIVVWGSGCFVYLFLICPHLSPLLGLFSCRTNELK